MLAAFQYFVKRDYRRAEKLYSQPIATNQGNIEAYLQRGLTRREMGDAPGAASDGRSAVLLASAALKSDLRDGRLYYQRSMGLRLLRQFDLTAQDMLAAIQLTGKQHWQTDLKAIELERKMMQ